jgi:hypothetical protein
MDPVEEQAQELEVLESIYPDELDRISDTHFTITIDLDTPSDRKHSLQLTIRYPETYPEVIPELDLDSITEEVDLEADYDSEDDEQTIASKRAINLAETVEFSKEDLHVLTSKLVEEANMQIGIPMIFALVTQLKDDAEALFTQNLNLKQTQYNKKREEQDMLEQKKFQGTPVTKESFGKWRSEFRKEMNIEGKTAERFKLMHNGKLSGKEIFEQGLAGDEEDELSENVKSMTV